MRYSGHTRRLAPRAAVIFSAILLSSAAEVVAQTAFYTFTSGPSGDGFIWDVDSPPAGLNDLPNGENFHAPDLDGATNNIENYSGNVTYFDTSYQAAGNSSLISDEAWWGNPTEPFSPTVGAYFVNTFNGAADSVAFDFAWAIAGEDAYDSLEIEVYDDDFDFAYLYFDLDSSFNAGPAFGGFQGWEGSIAFDLLDAQNDNFDVDAIAGFSIYLDPISTPGGVGEFAIDNLDINGGGATGFDGPEELYPASNDPDSLLSGFSTRWLKDTPVTSSSRFSFDVVNNTGSDTEFSASLDGTSDAVFLPGNQFSGEFLAFGDTQNITLQEVALSNPSGEYSASATLSNDLDPSDPDNTVNYGLKIYDAPAISSNAANPVQVQSGGQLTLANAAAGPHAGALRAGVEVTGRSITGPFQFAGSTLLIDDFVGPGTSAAESLLFSRFGRLTQTYMGSATIDLQMNSAAGSFLNGRQPVPSITWNLEFALADTLSDSANLPASGSLAEQVGVNNATTAATIVGGHSSTAQTVSMALVSDPEQGDATKSADLATSVVDLDFSISATSQLHVLQFTYLDGNLPSGFTEAQLELLVFDTGSDDWIRAIDANLDNGAGSAFFAGSYEDFLAGPGGGSLDAADQSKYGVDATNNMAWAVLNNEGLFSLGVLGNFALSADTEPDGDVDGADFLALQRDNPSLIPTWQTEYGSGSGAVLSSTSSSAGTVPEPGTFCLLCLFLGALRQFPCSRRAA
ncbi:hypothetical protein [Adhaeretor mobilis]|uniref:PEP-CTERM protein-sorting domain-containing protein n=1 Tax=Adhaeretor mobilis TaxID=1930276 RepID=A0A517N3K7_9BACT|nr:hypothetical protein [Adhaeretor mobilis]QDT01578.1 hypothetical protein HG15A2_49250 [Adhaeretor mobilis]